VEPFEPAVYVKLRGQRHEGGDLAGGAVVLVAEGDKQLVAWAERRDRLCELLEDLLSFQLLVGGGPLVGKPVENLGIEHDLDQTARSGGAACFRREASTMLQAIVVEAEPADNDDQPGGELASSIGREGSEPPEVLLPKPLDGKGVAVHHDILVVAGGLPRDEQDQAGVGLEKLAPCLLLWRTIRRLEEAAELAGERPGVFRTGLVAHRAA